MVHEDIAAVNVTLGMTLSRVSPEVAEQIRSCRRVLEGARDAAEALETETALALEVVNDNTAFEERMGEDDYGC